jgi:hypothetical protein
MIQPKDKTAICKDRRSIFSVILNILIVVFAAVGTVIMLSNQGDGTGLASSGITNLKYFTVLSNEFCGITAALWLVFFLLGKKFPPVLKLTAASAVALTFLIIAAFLAPMYPELDLYENANLWFHLILPLTAVLEFIILRTDEKIPFRYTVISALPALIYGIGYLANILVNGKGEWPDTNDWYGFLNWGYPAGMAIFAAIVLMDFAMAVLMRALNNRINKIS